MVMVSLPGLLHREDGAYHITNSGERVPNVWSLHNHAKGKDRNHVKTLFAYQHNGKIVVIIATGIKVSTKKLVSLLSVVRGQISFYRLFLLSSWSERLTSTPDWNLNTGKIFMRTGNIALTLLPGTTKEGTTLCGGTSIPDLRDSYEDKIAKWRTGLV